MENQALTSCNRFNFFFHPNKLILFPQTQTETYVMSRLSSLTKLAGMPESEVRKYIFVCVCDPTALKKNAVSSMDVDQFWRSVCYELPCMAACAKRYIFCNRKFCWCWTQLSIYNLILLDRRWKLSIDSSDVLTFYVTTGVSMTASFHRTFSFLFFHTSYMTTTRNFSSLGVNEHALLSLLLTQTCECTTGIWYSLTFLYQCLLM